MPGVGVFAEAGIQRRGDGAVFKASGLDRLGSDQNIDGLGCIGAIAVGFVSHKAGEFIATVIVRLAEFQIAVGIFLQIHKSRQVCALQQFGGELAGINSCLVVISNNNVLHSVHGRSGRGGKAAPAGSVRIQLQVAQQRNRLRNMYADISGVQAGVFHLDHLGDIAFVLGGRLHINNGHQRLFKHHLILIGAGVILPDLDLHGADGKGVGHFVLSGEVGQRAADHNGDQRNCQGNGQHFLLHCVSSCTSSFLSFLVNRSGRKTAASRITPTAMATYIPGGLWI